VEDDAELLAEQRAYEPDELNALLEAEGWRPRIEGTRWFVHGAAEPA
jgi:hypothetical protein